MSITLLKTLLRLTIIISIRILLTSIFYKLLFNKVNKLKGFKILNNRYYCLLALKLSDFKDTSKYIKKFKKIYNDIRNIYKKFKLNENFLIFLFYIKLRKEYKNYFLYYI